MLYYFGVLFQLLGDSTMHLAIEIVPFGEFSDPRLIVRSHRSSSTPIEIAVSGCCEPGQRELPERYADAGAIWWLETLFGLRGSVEEMLQRVEASPIE
jgi:hypothetical protein